MVNDIVLVLIYSERSGNTARAHEYTEQYIYYMFQYELCKYGGFLNQLINNKQKSTLEQRRLGRTANGRQLCLDRHVSLRLFALLFEWY